MFASLTRAFCLVLFPTYHFCRKSPPLSSPTMMDVGGPFQPFSTLKASKKLCTDKPNQVYMQHEFETPIRILFKKMPKACTQFNVLSNVKQVILAMMKVDPSLSVLP